MPLLSREIHCEEIRDGIVIKRQFFSQRSVKSCENFTNSIGLALLNRARSYKDFDFLKSPSNQDTKHISYKKSNCGAHVPKGYRRSCMRRLIKKGRMQEPIIRDQAFRICKHCFKHDVRTKGRDFITDEEYIRRLSIELNYTLTPAYVLSPEEKDRRNSLLCYRYTPV